MQSIHDNGKSLAQNTRVVLVFMLQICNIYVVLQYCVRHDDGAYASGSIPELYGPCQRAAPGGGFGDARPCDADVGDELAVRLSGLGISPAQGEL
jgi:hypothetical protein